jgi:hypothetical protein
MPDGMRGDPEADMLCKGLDHDSIGPRGGINSVYYVELRDIMMIEMIMRGFVAPKERLRFLPQGSRKDHWV